MLVFYPPGTGPQAHRAYLIALHRRGCTLPVPVTHWLTIIIARKVL